MGTIALPCLTGVLGGTMLYGLGSYSSGAHEVSWDDLRQVAGNKNHKGVGEGVTGLDSGLACLLGEAWQLSRPLL